MVIPEIHAETREEWRSWLQKNHKKETRVWLLKHKRHTGKEQVNNSDAMDDAICFGWIDTIVKRVDENTYKQQFVRRTGKSRWSANTIRRAERMIHAKRMTPEGLRRYNEGKAKPLLYDDVPDRYTLPEELQAALQKNKKANAFYATLPPSKKKVYHAWVHSAKQKKTKEERVEKILQACVAEKRIW